MNDLGQSINHEYVNVLTNSGFKALFGDENNKEVIMSIINVLLPEHRQLVEIEYMPTEYQGPIIDKSKEFRYDFMCKDAEGATFIVEMQNYQEDDWFQRCVSYACRAYDRQNRRGEDYNVPPVYLIGLMGVDVNHPDKEYWKNKFVSEYTFREKDCHDLLGETIFIIFAELAGFHKTDKECETHLDRMLYLLKNIGSLEELPDWVHDEVYSHVAAACKVGGFTEDKRIQYEKDMYDERRYNSEMKTAKRLGMEEGLRLGIEQGIEQGIEKGVEKGVAIGKIETAKQLKSLGVDINIIAQSTGIDIDQIKAL